MTDVQPGFGCRIRRCGVPLPFQSFLGLLPKEADKWEFQTLSSEQVL